MQPHRKTASVLAFALSVAMLLGLSGGVAAAVPGKANPPKSAKAECGTGRGIPDSKISIQLFTLRSTINQIGMEAVLAELAAMGYRNVEPFNFGGLTAEEFKDLLDEYGLKAPSRHGSTNEANWDTHLADAKTLNQKWVGSGGSASPGIRSYEDTLATAETLNRLGERSVENGTGKIYVHNHQQEFTNQYVDTQGDGELKSAWQLLVENTDPRYVAFQVDVLWAYDGGADVVELLEEYGDRIELLHIKDGTNIPAEGRATITNVGEGDIDWAAVLDAAQGKVKQYIIEHDSTQDPLETARVSLEYLDCLSF